MILNKVQELLSEGRNEEAISLLEKKSEMAQGGALAELLCRQSDVFFSMRRLTEAKYFGRNGAAGWINSGDYLAAIVWGGVHLARFPEDIYTKIIYRTALHEGAKQLRDQYPDQADQFLAAATELETEKTFLRTATEKEIIRWWQGLGDEFDRNALVPSINGLISTHEPTRAWILYRLISDRLTPVQEINLLQIMALNALLCAQPDCELHRQLMDQWLDRCGKDIIDQADILVWPETPVQPDRPLHIGFVDTTGLWQSRSCRDILLEPTVRCLSQSGYSVSYWMDSPEATEIGTMPSEDLPPHVRGWILNMDRADSARAIAAQSVDILLMVNGPIINPPLTLFASRPAKRLAMWLHTYGTCGGDLFDAILVDEHSYNETHARMSAEPAVGRWGLPVLVGQAHDAPPVADAPCLKNGYVTFGVIGRHLKWSPDCYSAWGKILAAIPTARLRLHGTPNMSDADLERLMAEIEHHDVPLDRVDHAGYQATHADYLASLAEIDIILDTYPYAGGLTTAEAIWQGVPVVSRLGESIPARTGLMYLGETHLRHLVVVGEEAFCQTAIDLAQDHQAIAVLRQTMRQELITSRLMNPDLFLPRFRAAMDELLALTPRCLPRLKAKRAPDQALA